MSGRHHYLGDSTHKGLPSVLRVDVSCLVEQYPTGSMGTQASEPSSDHELCGPEQVIAKPQLLHLHNGENCMTPAQGLLQEQNEGCLYSVGRAPGIH